MRTLSIAASMTALAMAVAPTMASAQAESPNLADSFRLGSGGGVLCQVQTRSRDDALVTMFDRAWTIVCRDAATPVGRVYALRGDGAAVRARLAGLRANEAQCSAQATAEVDDIGTVETLDCRSRAAPISYRVLSTTRGGVTWVAEGLGGYQSALTLALRTVILDRYVPGSVTVATTSVDDPAAFARVQAGTLDPDLALAEGYRRNNSGNYAEAAEFFDTLSQRDAETASNADRAGEYLINRALQKSNLGEFAEATALLEQAERLPTNDRVQSRLRRNFRAIHWLNQTRYEDAIAELDKPIAPLPPPMAVKGSAIEIGARLADNLNAAAPGSRRLGATESTALTQDERATFLDAQALQLRGTLLRLSGKPAVGREALEKAYADVLAVRDGRVVSVIRLRSQILAETALAYEAEGNRDAAEAKMRESLALLETRYPQTVAVNGARARLAALLARFGKTTEAMAEYRSVVASAATNRSTLGGLGNLLNPYFALLAREITTNPALVNDMFVASQTLVRPGVADTQAILARELSEGSSEASSLFRQARTLERDIERARIERATIVALPEQTGATRAAIASLEADIATYAAQQTELQARLSAFPQYRAVATQTLTLAELQSILKPGEGYYKLLVVGGAAYGMYIESASATGFKLAASEDELDAAVDALRETISVEEGGQRTTYPFDVDAARKLYLTLFAPVADRVTQTRHLIFKADGAMLRLPPGLLITDDASVTAFKQRQATAGADEFDFRGLAWLGRDRAISTVVAARAFRDARMTPASKARAQYLGLGQNAPVSRAVRASITRSPSLASGTSLSCEWPTSEWDKPIAATELKEAQSIIGADRSQLMIGSDFTDTAVRGRTDLADYRILHFATHGLISAPRPQCPARPALLTSFGDSGSDGLLTFKEIFDLKIDADFVILSACDTAGRASVAATREAGISTGGGNALDGLVRAFIGAGGRSVLASHWPAPDDFNATARLISGLFKATPGTTIGGAMAAAQSTIMDDQATSHPYYWAGFAIIGDSAQQMLTAR